MYHHPVRIPSLVFGAVFTAVALSRIARPNGFEIDGGLALGLVAVLAGIAVIASVMPRRRREPAAAAPAPLPPLEPLASLASLVEEEKSWGHDDPLLRQFLDGSLEAEEPPSAEKPESEEQR